MATKHQQRCIYCLRGSSATVGYAHVFPEALVPEGPTLPLGAVCDHCNHYIGANLETALIGHPLIAFPIQMVGLPGKKGKARKKLGIFERGIESDMVVTFPVARPSLSVDPNDDRIARFSFSATPSSVGEMDRLRRALHHIALNLWALNRGVESALEPRFNAVRHYVRRPRPRERWPFVQLVQQLTFFENGVGARRVPFEGAELMRIRIFNTEFWVDLLNTGIFRRALVTGDGQGHGMVVDPDWKPVPHEAALPGVHHRISIGSRQLVSGNGDHPTAG